MRTDSFKYSFALFIFKDGRSAYGFSQPCEVVIVTLHFHRAGNMRLFHDNAYLRCWVKLEEEKEL